MVKLIFLSTLLLLTFSGKAQNLVPNPSFEAYEYLPARLSSEGRDFELASKHWTTPNQASTDLVSPRMKSGNLETIPPHSGLNMAGIVINGDFWAEYAGVKLKQPIKAGVTYYCEYWISRPTYYSRKKPVPTYLNNYFGVKVAEETYKYDKNILKGQPQLFANDKILVEPEKWTKVSGTFVAQDSASHLYLGQFYDEKDKEKMVTGYFFIDDIFLEPFNSNSISSTPSRYFKIEDGVAIINMENLYFQTDSNELEYDSFEELKKLVDLMGKNSQLKVRIQSELPSGSGESTQALAQSRAQAVRQYLLNQRIAPERIENIGFKAKDSSTDDITLNTKGVNGKKASRLNLLDPEQIYRFADEINPKDHDELAFIGKDERSWDCTQAGSPIRIKPIQEDSIIHYKPTPAIDFILEKTKTENLVFINESNRFPQTRALLHLMLDSLYEQGYRYLALEGLSNSDVKITDRKYPIMRSGYALKEPVYGDLARKAMEIGFTLLAYRPSKDQSERAEKIVKKKMRRIDQRKIKSNAKSLAQAQNLLQLVSERPNDKMIVFCKAREARKLTINDRKGTAAWYKDLSEKDPFTIDQCNMIPQCSSAENTLYSKYKDENSVIFVSKDEAFVQHDYDAKDKGFKPTYDLQVFHGRHAYPYNRPAWMQMKGYRKAYNFDPAEHGMSYPCMVRAYKKGEDVKKAVPVDVIEMSDPGAVTGVMLPVGEYILVAKDRRKSKTLDVVVGE